MLHPRGSARNDSGCGLLPIRWIGVGRSHAGLFQGSHPVPLPPCRYRQFLRLWLQINSFPISQPILRVQICFTSTLKTVGSMFACSFMVIVAFILLVGVFESLAQASGGLSSSYTSGHRQIGHAYNAAGESSKLQGWTPQPNGRGSIDIIWSNSFTIFLCSWSVLCLNLPAPRDSAFRRLRRKIYLTGLGILGPEFILLLALGQWEPARRSVKDFNKSGYSGWSMSIAYFADMGGFVLHSPN